MASTLVAQGMAKPFVEISSKHIIPGINQVDRLLFVDDGTQPEASPSGRLVVVLATAQKAQDEIKNMRQRYDLHDDNEYIFLAQILAQARNP